MPQRDSSGCPSPRADAPQGGSLERTALPAGPDGRWRLKLYRQAGQATVWLAPGASPRRQEWEQLLTPAPPERIEADSAQRAKSRIARYMRANRIDHMWTLTFAEAVYDYGALAVAVAGFERRLREARVRGPLVLLPEPHPNGHGWHLHAGLRGFRPIEQMRALWGQGHVFVTGPGRGRKRQWGPRQLAGYLSKYLTKQIGADELAGCTPRPKGAHRYWRTEQYEPVADVRGFASLADLFRWLTWHYGVPDEVVEFRGGDTYKPEGYWLSFPDEYLDPPPRAP